MSHDCLCCADTGKSTDSGLPNIRAAASQVQSFLTHGANATFAPNATFGLPTPPHQNGTGEAKAIGSLVASSVQLGADLAASGHAVSLAADERVSSALSWPLMFMWDPQPELCRLRHAGTWPSSGLELGVAARAMLSS